MRSWGIVGRLARSGIHPAPNRVVTGLPGAELSAVGLGMVEVGTRLKLQISRKGSESSQGVAYLGDGTMIVVESATDQLGEELDIEIISTTWNAIREPGRIASPL